MFLWHHQGLGCTDPPCGNNLCIRLNFRCNTATSHHDVCVRADCDLMSDSSSLIRSDFPGCLSSCPGSRKWDGHVTVLASTAVIHPGAAALHSPLHGLNVIEGTCQWLKQQVNMEKRLLLLLPARNVSNHSGDQQDRVLVCVPVEDCSTNWWQ